MKKDCKKHGHTEFAKERGRWRCKRCRTESVQRYRLRIKERAIAYKGGKCQKCGYNTCDAALDFHHRDPSKKKFSVGSKGYTRSWAQVQKELDKCDLLCANCHRELHWEISNTEREVVKDTSKLDSSRKPKHEYQPVFIKCKTCGKRVRQTHKSQKYCSLQCAYYGSRKIKHPTKQQLKKAMGDKPNWSALGRKYGVSDTAVRKWARRYDLI